MAQSLERKRFESVDKGLALMRVCSVCKNVLLEHEDCPYCSVPAGVLVYQLPVS